MAAITIRTLSDEVVAALKQRAKRNSRSMEAEVRDVLTRIAAGESALEQQLAARVRATPDSTAALTSVRAAGRPSGIPSPRTAVLTSDLRTWIAANPPPPVDGDAWLADIRDDDDVEDFRDPWEHHASS